MSETWKLNGQGGIYAERTTGERRAVLANIHAANISHDDKVSIVRAVTAHEKLNAAALSALVVLEKQIERLGVVPPVVHDLREALKVSRGWI